MLATDEKKKISLSERSFKADFLNKISTICQEGAECFVPTFHILYGFKINIMLKIYSQAGKGKGALPLFLIPKFLGFATTKLLGNVSAGGIYFA